MRRFELVEGGSAKFWEIGVEGSAVTVRFGRLGTSGQEKVHALASPADAEKKAAQLVAEKTRKGYAEVGAGIVPAQVAAPKDAPRAAPKDAPRAAPKDAPRASSPGSSALEKALAPYAKSLGAGIPAELTALWQHALAKKDAAFFGSPTYGEVTLSARPAGVDAYLDSAEGEAWAGLFADVVWIGEEADGGLVGYDRHGGGPVDRVLYLDNEGSLSITGRTLVDHFAWRVGFGDEDAEHTALGAFCEAAGLPGPRASAARKDSVAGAPSPEARFRALAASLRAARGPASRPVDRSPTTCTFPDGRWLVVSSEDDVTHRVSYDANAAFVFDPVLGGFSLLAETPFKAYLNAALPGTLRDGRVPFLALGGEVKMGFFLPASGTWETAAPLAANHEDGAALRLDGDHILLVSRSGTHLWDPATSTWTARTRMGAPRRGFGAVVLRDGRVLTAGGQSSSYADQQSVEIHDPRTDVWTRAADLPKPVSHVAMLVLDDGRVLLTRGDGYTFYDPAADAWTPFTSQAGVSQSMLKLDDGRIAFFSGTRVSRLDPIGGTVEAAGTCALTRDASTRAFALPDGRVLLVGGTLYNNIASEPEIWDPRTGEGSALPGFEKPFDKQRKALARRK